MTLSPNVISLNLSTTTIFKNLLNLARYFVLAAWNNVNAINFPDTHIKRRKTRRYCRSGRIATYFTEMFCVGGVLRFWVECLNKKEAETMLWSWIDELQQSFDRPFLDKECSTYAAKFNGDLFWEKKNTIFTT